MVREISIKNECTFASQIVSLFPNVLEAVESLNLVFLAVFINSSATSSLNRGVCPVLCNSSTVLKLLYDLRTDI